MTNGSGHRARWPALLGRTLAADRTPVVPKPAPKPKNRNRKSKRTARTGAEPEAAPERGTDRNPRPNRRRNRNPNPNPNRKKKPEDAEEPPRTGSRAGQARLRRLARQLRLRRRLRRDAEMPYLAATLRPQGEPAEQLLKLLDEAALPNSIAAISGQPPNAATKADCPTFTDFPPARRQQDRASSPATAASTRSETLSLGDQLDIAQLHLARLHGRDGRPDHRRAGQLRPPRSRSSRGDRPGRLLGEAQPLRLLPLAARPRRLLGQRRAAHRTEEGPEEVEATTPNYSYISPNLCNAGVAGQCPAGAPEGAGGGRRLPRELVPEILESPAYKKDGAADRHLQRGQPAPTRTRRRRRRRSR